MANNFTAVTNVQTFLSLANDNTGGWFWLVILSMIYAVLFISLISFGMYPALISSSFVVLILGMLLAYMGLIAWVWVLFIIAVLVLTFIWVGYSSSKYQTY